MKYIDADLLKKEIKRLKDEYTDIAIDSRHGWVNANFVIDDLEQLQSQIDSLQQEQESVAERFARIVRGNLIGIDKEVQQKFEQLYFEVTGNKMYGGYND
jgi:hypothetical protein